jgi:hypothetical protein
MKLRDAWIVRYKKKEDRISTKNKYTLAGKKRVTQICQRAFHVAVGHVVLVVTQILRIHRSSKNTNQE